MKAVIMAGGEGTRLRPLTCSIPKPMVPVAGKPTMEHIINLLKKHDIKDIASTLYYLPDSIVDYFLDGKRFGVNLTYFIEEKPLGTGGSVLNAKEFLDDTFIVISGDALTDINLKKAIKYHISKGSKATLVLKRESIPLEFGIVITNSEGRIIRFLEKPGWGEVFSDTINTGIYILEPEVFNYYKKGDNFDFSRDLFPRLLNDNVPMFGYITDEYWCDIGDLNSYLQTNFDVLDGKVDVELDAVKKMKGIWVGRNTIISDDAVLKGPCYIGSNCLIKSGSSIGPYSIIGNNTVVSENTSIKHSVLWDFNRIGGNNQIRGSIICSKVVTKELVNFFEGSVTGSETNISSSVIVKPDIKIWPNKYIKEHSIVDKNLVWGTKYSRLTFDDRGISGEINIDVTPEFASLLGSAFASVMGKDLPLVISSDGSKPAGIIKESLASGILSSGVKVINIDDIPLFVSRYATRFYKAGGGIHISSDSDNGNKVYIQFLNIKGGDIERNKEKKIEHLFTRQDFERCNASELGSIIRVENFSSLYVLNNLLQIKNIERIKSKSPDIFLASADDRALDIVSLFLKDIGCRVHCDYTFKEHSSLEEYAKKIVNDIKDKPYLICSIIDTDGIVLIDNKGRVIDRDKYSVLSSLIALKQNANTLVIPHTSTMIIDEMAKTFNARVKRTKASNSDFINELLYLSDTNEYVYLQYLLYFDPALALGKITEFLIENSLSLFDVVDELPEFYMCKEEVNCSFEERGRVIRQLIDENNNDVLELFEGIKLNTEKGWTLILPDNSRPVLNIFVEGYCQEFAEELSAQVKEKLNLIINNK